MYITKFAMFFLLCFLLLPAIGATSLFNAQDYARQFLQNSEMIDTYNSQPITCNSDSYFMIPVVNSAGEPSFFVPVSSKTGVIYLSNKTEENLKILKTGFVLRTLSQSSSSNYLTQQLIDRINIQVTLLNSKKAQLDGIIDSNYSSVVDSKVSATKSKLESLTTSLSDLSSSLYSLLKKQQSFIVSPSCIDIDSVIIMFDSSFEGYAEITSQSIAYTDSANELTSIIVADNSIDDSSKRMLLSYISAPSSLSSEIGQIYDSISSTSQFYSSISLVTTSISGKNNLTTYLSNLMTRRDYVTAKSMLYDYDSDFKGYNNLDTVIQTITASDNEMYWLDQEDVQSIKHVYPEINDLYSKGKYTEAIPKINQAKALARKIISDGFVQFESSTSSTGYYILAGGLLLIVILIIIIVRHRSKKEFDGYSLSVKRTKFAKKESADDLLGIRDPFD